MCRFVAYLGEPVVMRDLLFTPEHSLIVQSRHATERADPLNADGFGIGFYLPEVNPEPAVFVAITPAWSNRNLRYNADRVRSGCIFGHVRAASHGEVAEMNCHPFHYRRLLMMHNGNLGGFRTIKRRLRSGLSDESYHWIEGQTDSEHLFATFLDRLSRGDEEEGSTRRLTEALRSTIAQLGELRRQCKVEEPSFLNLAVTDGRSIVATRYVSDPSLEPASLFYAVVHGEPSVSGGWEYRPEVGEKPVGVVVASERLGGSSEQWRPVPRNHLVVVGRDHVVQVTPIDA